MSRKHKAFTLVELLVVIGIIALLIAVLLPALNRARMASQKLDCSSHMRTLGQSMHTYAADMRGYLTPTTANRYDASGVRINSMFNNGTGATKLATDEDSWVGLLMVNGYLRPNDKAQSGLRNQILGYPLLLCPLRDIKSETWHYNPAARLLGIAEINKSGPPNANFPCTPLAKLQPAVNVVLLAETWGGSPNRYPNFTSIPGGNTVGEGWDVAHDQKYSNLLFVDGHVSEYRYLKTPVRPTGTGSNAKWCFPADWEEDIALGRVIITYTGLQYQ